MSSGLKVGDLFVVFTANTTQFTKGVRKIVKQMEQTAKQVEAIGAKMGQIGLAASAGIAAAVAAAARANPKMAAQVDRLKQLWFTLAADIGNTFAPMMEKQIRFVEKLVVWFQNLSPEVKEMAARVVGLVAVIGVAGGIIGKFAGLAGAAFQGLGIALQAVGALVSSGLIVPIAIAAAVAGTLIIIAGLIRQAWDDNLGGIRELAAAVWKWMGDTAKLVFDYFSTGTSDLMSWFGTAFKWIIDYAVGWATDLLSVIDGISSALGINLTREIDGIKRGIQGLGEDLKNPGEMLARSAEFAGAAWDYTAKGIKRNFVDLKGLASGLLKDVMPSFDGTGPRLATETGKEAKPNAVMRFSEDEVDPIESKLAGWMFAQEELTAGLRKMAAAAQDAIKSKVVDKMGRVGGLARAAQQGAEAGMAAGPKGAVLGAVGGVMLELVTQSEGFQNAIAAADGVIQALSNAMGRFLEPLTPLIAVSGLIVEGIDTMLRPSMEMVGNIFKSFTPTVLVLGTVFQALAPIFGMLLQGLLLLASNGILLFIPVALGMFFDIVKVVGLGILKVVQWMSDFWNQAMNAIAGFIDMIAGFTFNIGEAVFQPFAALGDYANSIRKGTIDQKALAESIQLLEGLTWAEAMAKADAIAAQKDQTEAVIDATNALTNMPEGVKYNLRKFQSMAAQTILSAGGSVGNGNQTLDVGGSVGNGNQTLDVGGLPHLADGGIVRRKTVAVIGEAGPEAVVPLKGRRGGGAVTINVYPTKADPVAVAREVVKLQKKQAHRMTGSVAGAF